jgi:hypothetical protein
MVMWLPSPEWRRSSSARKSAVPRLAAGVCGAISVCSVVGVRECAPDDTGPSLEWLARRPP